MSTYAIGDLQGCFDALQQLLLRIAFDPAVDQVYLLGDLVNRGVDSLAVLRWAREHDIKAILGNHDLHLLAVSEGYATPHTGDTLHGVLTAPDREELLTWLRHLPLAASAAGFLMVHAGLLPQWTASRALALATEVEAALRSPDYRDFLREMYGNKPAGWDDDLRGYDRLRVITNAMTRLRFCTPQGEMEFKTKGDPAYPPTGFLPWFQVPGRRSEGSPIVFGHWSALGLREESDCIALDTGCLWGGQLTALRLEDRQVFQVECAGLAGTVRWQ
ncbi:MAG: symmetrical bis(5'-nucleosyl)-tetraphosphatase [Sulfuriferula sp.]|nr:symmetrical bis(5'-nucleosyl)-tetraphosphatase [Sulfuriferula sp.]